MRAALDTLATILAEAVADAECEAEVVVTAGRPAAPSDEGRDCQTVIYVWGQTATDLNQGNDEACIARSRWEMQYEIQTCYPEDWYDPIDTEDADATVDCLYELMELVWCALVAAKDNDTLAGCCFTDLLPFEVQPRSGGAVSALGSVTIPYNCEPTSP